jgi:hypothetical protein
MVGDPALADTGARDYRTRYSDAPDHWQSVRAIGEPEYAPAVNEGATGGDAPVADENTMFREEISLRSWRRTAACL